MFGDAAVPLVAGAGMLKTLGTLAGFVLMTAQVSRAAADHGLLPQVFARTRAGDTPVAGLIVAGLIGTVALVLTISPTLGQQFDLLIEASTTFALLTYLGACLAAIKYRVRGEYSLAIVCGGFCLLAILFGWSKIEVVFATLACMVFFVLCYLPLSRRKYLLPDVAVRTGEARKLRERYDDAENR
jgi:arginine:agmatine antiporter